MGVSPSLKLIRKVKNLIEMMLTISSRTRTEHKCAALEESHRHSRCPLLEQPPQQLVGNRQAQSTWALGEDPVGQIFSRCGRMCIGPVWIAVLTISERVLPELWFLGRLK